MIFRFPTPKAYNQYIANNPTKLGEYRVMHERYLDQYPYFYQVEDDYYTLDEYESALLERFGFQHGECKLGNSVHGCPHSTYIPNYWEDAYDEPNSFWATRYPDRNEFLKSCEAPPSYEHSHKGTWVTQWLGKTNYDYGYQNFYFKTKEQLEEFKSIILLGTAYTILS